LFELLEEPALIRAGRVEDQVVDTCVDVLAISATAVFGSEATIHRFAMSRMDNTSAAFRFGRIGQVVLLLPRQSQRRPEPGVPERQASANSA
jgi:hypothetical protein